MSITWFRPLRLPMYGPGSCRMRTLSSYTWPEEKDGDKSSQGVVIVIGRMSITLHC